MVSEIISKLGYARDHLQDLEHECNNVCYGVDNLNWSIGQITDFETIRSFKKNFTLHDDHDLEQNLTKFGETSNKEVADYLSTRFRSMNPSKDMSRRVSNGLEWSRGQLNGPYGSRRQSNPASILDQKDMRPPANIGTFVPDDSISSWDSFDNENQDVMDWLTKNVDDWGCNVFEMNELTTEPLANVTYICLKKRNLFEALNIPSKVIVKYVSEVEQRYRSSNPYHNRLHAADVTQTMHFLLNTEPMFTIFSDIEVFALIFSSVIHDVDHPGVNNPFLIKSRDRNAILYNDSHVNENHHLAVAFQLLYKDKHHFLTYIPEEEADFFRQLVIQLVLSTDMNLHVGVTSDFLISVEQFFIKDNHIPDAEERLKIMKGLLHFADISNPTKPLEVYQTWCKRVTEEFFLQGDLERSKGMDISPLCDRAKADISKAQTGFINYIVTPLFDIVDNFLSVGDDASLGVSYMLGQHLSNNYTFYKNYYTVHVDKPVAEDNFSENRASKENKSNFKFTTPIFFHVNIGCGNQKGGKILKRDKDLN